MSYQLYLRDSREILGELEPHCADLIFCDPIYSDYGFYRFVDFEFSQRVSRDWDYTTVLQFVNTKHLWSANRNIRIFSQLLSVVKQTHNELNGDIIAKCHHLLWTGSKRTKNGKMPDGWISNSWPEEYNVATAHKWTKNPLYIGLVIEKFTNPGDTIADPCMGSGLIGYMAVRMGRNYIGIEKDADTFARAEKVLLAAQEQPRLELRDTQEALEYA